MPTNDGLSIGKMRSDVISRLSAVGGQVSNNPYPFHNSQTPLLINHLGKFIKLASVLLNGNNSINSKATIIKYYNEFLSEYELIMGVASKQSLKSDINES